MCCIVAGHGQHWEDAVCNSWKDSVGKKRRRGLLTLVVAERLLADWKVSCQFGKAIQREGRLPPESVYLDDTHFTQSPSVHLRMIVLMGNSPRSVRQQLPLPHLWSLCFRLRVRTQLKTIKARLGQRCVLTAVRGARTRGGGGGYLITLFWRANQGESLFSASVNGLY